MYNRERPYFTLFTEICDAIENIELVLNETNCSDNQRETLQAQIDSLNAAQQCAEEEYISQRY